MKTVIYEIVANVTPDEEVSLKSLLSVIKGKFPDSVLEEKSVPTEPSATPS